MPSPRAAVTQAELTRYAKAMRAAGYDDWRLEVAKPDGTKVKIVAGKAGDGEAPADEFDTLIGRVPDP